MANNILAKYGIKEVADVCFYDIKTGKLELYLDTLKVSTIEQTAENVSARGGKGNPELIVWDYGKEITVTLEDALFSAKSMAILFGDGKTDATVSKVTRAVRLKAKASGTAGSAFDNTITLGKTTISFPTTATFIDAETGTEIGATSASFVGGKDYIVNWDATPKDSTVITITGDSFPGTYKVIGDTYARSEATGQDEFFQFVIEKAKITAENTITLEAEGDPTVFNLSLRVLRNSVGEMMKLIKYSLEDVTPSQN